MITDSEIVVKVKVEIFEKTEILSLQAVRALWSDNVPFAEGSNKLII